MTRTLRLEGPLPAWDVERRQAAIEPLVGWVVTSLASHGLGPRALDRLHEHVDAAKALELSRTLSFEASRSKPFALVRQLLERALPELPWPRLAIQAVPHLRILVPGDAVAPVPPHTDFDIGHALDGRNVWFALTPAFGTAALGLTTLAHSMELRRDHTSLPSALELPVAEAPAGTMLLFTPLHAHRAHVIREDTTRVSLDIRIAPLEAVRARGATTFVAAERP